MLLVVTLSSCKKDHLTWNLKRSSPKDANLEVANLIYSNNCSSFSDPSWSGSQFIVNGLSANSSFYYWKITNEGIDGQCFRTIGERLYASIEFNMVTSEDLILRFYIKTIYLSSHQKYNIPKISINSLPINTAIISDNEKDGGVEWVHMQTEIIKKGNNSYKIEFIETNERNNNCFVDEIELWTPLY